MVGFLGPYGHDNFPGERSTGRKVLDGIASAHGAAAPRSALAFSARPGGLFTIPKAARVEHAEENAGAGDLHLNDADLAAIDKAFPRGKASRSLPML